MTTPEDCAKNFPDEPGVKDACELLRRIPPQHFVPDEKPGRLRPSSAAFDDDKYGDPMSVYLQDVIRSEGGDCLRVLAGHEGYALASITAGQVRTKNQTVSPDPLPEESAHANVCGPKPKSTQRWFAKQAQWVVPPPIS